MTSGSTLLPATGGKGRVGGHLSAAYTTIWQVMGVARSPTLTFLKALIGVPVHRVSSAVLAGCTLFSPLKPEC